MPVAGWMHGKVRWFDELRGEGLIRGDCGESYYVHYSSIKSTKKRKTLKKDTSVRFKLLEDSHFTYVSEVGEAK